MLDAIGMFKAMSMHKRVRIAVDNADEPLVGVIVAIGMEDGSVDADGMGINYLVDVRVDSTIHSLYVRMGTPRIVHRVSVHS